MVVDPRFTRSASVADFYVADPLPGTDIVFLGGIINYLITNDRIQHEYVKATTPTCRSSCARTSRFDDGLFSGYDDGKSASTTRAAGTTRWATTASPRSIRRCSIRAACTSC
jgi:formate dehydrogenase major subunit